MLHVFPEVDSKHSESEWNQDSECVAQIYEHHTAYQLTRFNANI